jgi:D-alanyl-lipoteichoic acid acyltransferase DltB (MBOAT superfamily)
VLFSSADYPVFLLCVFFVYTLLRSSGGAAAMARVALIILLGDLVYLLLCKDVGSLWDPLGGLLYANLVEDPVDLPPLWHYGVGTAILAGGAWLGARSGAWLDSDRGQSRLALVWTFILLAIGAGVTAAWLGGDLGALSATFAEIGHALYLFGVGIAIGAGLRARSQHLGRLVLFFVASIIFYHAWAASMWGGYLYLVCLILATIVLDYYLALAIERSSRKSVRLFLLVTSLVTNLGVLAMFKYLDFFLVQANSVAGWFDYEITAGPLGLILPAGISFHTFQSLSYTIDVYREKVPATRSVLTFATYVLFFPQLVAGPIVRAHEFLPQLQNMPAFDDRKAAAGIYRILVGLFKKIAIADLLAIALVDGAFAEPTRFSALESLFAVYGYAFQIYLDFSAYSDIAIGSAMLFGFDFPENFRTPYRSGDLQEFWRRWHITLSSWLRDYLYIPLGGSRKGAIRTYINLLITMLLGGLWHGASWTFIVWGALHGGGLAVTRVFQRRHQAAPDDAKRLMWTTIIIACAGVSMHVLIAGDITGAGDWLGFDDPTWLHLILGWAYITPAWACATAWLTATPAPEIAAPARLGQPWLARYRYGRRGFAAATVFIALVVYLGPGMLDLFALAAWLGFAYYSDAVRHAPNRAQRDAYTRWALRRTVAGFLVFHYVCFAWIFFRAVNFGKARDLILRIGDLSTDHLNLGTTFLFALAVAAVTHLLPTRSFEWAKQRFVELPFWGRAGVMLVCALALRALANPKAVPFIYFQF